MHPEPTNEANLPPNTPRQAVEPARWQRLEDLFDAALQRPHNERAAFVRANTDQDPELAAEVEQLLSSHESVHPLLDERAPEVLPAGTRIGAYRIERVLGSGGMGTVFLASRADRQFEKLVAIKLIAPLFGWRMTAARFHGERRILATLEHPNIARILDAGISANGQPYLVMEYVEGETLDVWLDAHPSTSLAARLELWRKVATAVVHAHRRLIIHRDIKPANILVDAAGEPKLVDFGIAKLVTDSNTGAETAGGFRLFTPLFASPEQIRGAPLTTAVDIYALGVALFVMLVGRRPFDDAAGVLESDPLLPSSIPADLRAICTKAMEKDPAKRYGTVDQFIDDVDRFAAGKPVLAQRQTMLYRSAKFVRRHWRAFSLACAAATIITATAVIAVYQARTAERERLRAEKVTEFVMRLLGGYPGPQDPELAAHLQQMRVVDVIDRARARIATELSDRPAVEADLRQSLATIYIRLGRFEDSRVEIERSLALMRQLYGPDSPRSLMAEAVHATMLVNFGRFQEAEREYRRVEALLRPMPPDIRYIIVPNFAVALLRLGKLEDAEQELTTGLKAFEAPNVPLHPTVALAYNALGLVRIERGDLNGAVHALERCAAVSRSFSPPAESLGWCLINLGNVRRFEGRFAESGRAGEQAAAALSSTLGPAHPSLVHALCLQGLAIAESGGDGEPVIQRAWAILRKAVPANHFENAVPATFLGAVRIHDRRYVDAVGVLQPALELRRKTFAAPNWRIAETAGYLGEALVGAGRTPEGIPLLEEAAETFLRLYGPNSPRTRDAQARLARGLAVSSGAAKPAL